MNQIECDLYGGILRDSVIFRGLPPETLDPILQRGMLLDGKAGDLVLFEKMRSSPGLYIVLAGRIEVFVSGEESAGNDASPGLRLATLGPGHCFGEYSLMDGKKTSASARAIGDSKLFFIPRGEFMRIVENDHLAGKIIYRNFLLILIERLRRKNDDLDPLISQVPGQE